MTNTCPVCNAETIAAYGDKESDILLVGSSPSEDEVKYGRPFVGSTIQIFKKEMFKNAHIDLSSCRQVFAEFHDKLKKKDCLLISLSKVEKEFAEKKFVILVGSSAVTAFTGLSILNVNGFEVTDEVMEYQSDLIGDKYPDLLFFAISSPQTVFKSLGETRFGLQNLGKWIEEKRYGNGR